MSTIDEVEQDLLQRAKGASVAELGTIAEAMKAVSETKYNEINARDKRRENWLEMLKSFATVLVPVISLGALYETIVAQNKQIEAGQRQIEDTEWRDLLSSLKGGSDSVYSDPVVAPRLRSFFASPFYGDQAKSIASRLMGHISNPDGFRDLFSTVFGDVNQQSVEPVLDIGRTLLASEQALQARCNEALIGADIAFDPGMDDCGIYSNDANAGHLMVSLKVPADIAVQLTAWRRSDLQLERENSFLDTKIYAFLRARYHIAAAASARAGLDLSGMDILLSDFSDLDLTGFDLVGTIFDTVDFRGAVIEPKSWTQSGATGDIKADFRGSTWWEARRIRPDLLSFLIVSWPPYPRAGVRYPQGYVIGREDYENKVRSLCRTAGIACPRILKFGLS